MCRNTVKVNVKLLMCGDQGFQDIYIWESSTDICSIQNIDGKDIHSGETIWWPLQAFVE